MKIYTFTDFAVPFEVVTVNYAIHNLPAYFDCEVQTYSFDDLKCRHLEKDSDNDVICLFEIGYPQHAGMNAKMMRNWWPNAKFVTLCCDTMHYMVNKLPFQLPDQKEEVELTLELMPQCAEWFTNAGIKTDMWMWTVSDILAQKLLDLAGEVVDFERKTTDFIGVYGPWTIENPTCWRHHAVNYIRNNGYSFTQGGGTGHNDTNLGKIYQAYLNSWLTLGTTSHNNPQYTRLGCMKGFRDWIGHLLNCPLIYDNHPNIIKLFNTFIPYYQYENLDSILYCIKYWKSEIAKNEYKLLIKTQRQWALENSIDKQLVKLLVKHGIISHTCI